MTHSNRWRYLERSQLDCNTWQYVLQKVKLMPHAKKKKLYIQILSLILRLFPPLLSVREYKDKNTGVCVWKCNKNLSYFHIGVPTASLQFKSDLENTAWICIAATGYPENRQHLLLVLIKQLILLATQASAYHIRKQHSNKPMKCRMSHAF